MPRRRARPSPTIVRGQEPDIGRLGGVADPRMGISVGAINRYSRFPPFSGRRLGQLTECRRSHAAASSGEDTGLNPCPCRHDLNGGAERASGWHSRILPHVWLQDQQGRQHAPVDTPLDPAMAWVVEGVGAPVFSRKARSS